MNIYFNSRELPPARNEYIAFLDIMGTKAQMKNSIPRTANFIFKLHAAILTSWRNEKNEGVFVYPVMDGAYITASRKENIEKMLVRIYDSLSQGFISEPDNEKRFVIQTGLAYGKVIHGHKIPYSASKTFELDLSYKNNILLGPAMIEAYESSNNAAPFGIYISDSAIKKKGKRIKAHGSFEYNWKWHSNKRIKTKTYTNDMKNELLQLFDSYKELSNPLNYDSEEIDKHIQLIKDYYNDFDVT